MMTFTMQLKKWSHLTRNKNDTRGFNAKNTDIKTLEVKINKIVTFLFD